MAVDYCRVYTTVLWGGERRGATTVTPCWHFLSMIRRRLIDRSWAVVHEYHIQHPYSMVAQNETEGFHWWSDLLCIYESANLRIFYLRVDIT